MRAQDSYRSNPGRARDRPGTFHSWGKRKSLPDIKRNIWWWEELWTVTQQSPHLPTTHIHTNNTHVVIRHTGRKEPSRGRMSWLWKFPGDDVLDVRQHKNAGVSWIIKRYVMAIFYCQTARNTTISMSLGCYCYRVGAGQRHQSEM